MPALLVSLLSLLPWLGQSQSNVPAPFVVASLKAIPSTTQACSELIFSGSKSTESRGEPLQYFWGFGPGTPSWFRIPLLAGILEEATAQSMSTIVISPAILSKAGSALGDLREGEVRLEVRLTVRNDLGNSTETVASASIIGLTSQAEPAVSAIGATEITLPHSDALHLAVSTREAPFALQCADRNPGTSAGRTNVTWHYRSSNQLSWQSLDASSANGLLRDLAKDPNKVHLAPLAFQPGTFHLFRAVAAFDMRPTLAPRPHVMFRVAVEPLPQVKVYIIGPRLASQCDFELEAEVWDPVRPTAPKEDFQFSWICSSVVQVGERDACAQLPQFGADFPKTDGTGGRGSKIRVASGQLPAGMHRFSVIVRRVSGGPESIARKAVQVNSSFFAPLRLQFPSYGYSGIVQLPDGVPQVSAFMDLSSVQCSTPTGVQWRWFLVEDRLTAVVERALSTTYNASDGLLHLWSGSGCQLTAGVPYFHVLLQSESQEMLDQVLAENRPALDSVLQNGVAIAAQSPMFVADQAPLGGLISVMPGFRGLSLRTTFRINTSQWQDEDLLGLEYEFLTFPFQAINQSAQDLGIDWEDPDSDSFWMKLGGRRFRPFDRSPQAFLQAPPGSHSIVVRARDVRGSISVISSSMPLAVDAEHNFSVPDATALLARVEVTNDVTQLLQAVHVISLIADPAVKVKTCSTDFFGSVTCDQIPSAEVVRPALKALAAAVPFVQTSDTLGKLGLAVEGMVRVAFEPVRQSVDVTAVFGNSLDPDQGNFTEDSSEQEHSEKVFANVTRIQVLPEFLTSMASVLTMGQQQMLLHQASNAVRGLEGFAAQEAWSAIVSLLSAVQGTSSSDGPTLTQQVRALIDGLGALALPLLPVGRELSLRSPPNQTVRADMILAKVDAGSNIRLPGLLIPRDVAGGQGLQNCAETEVQLTEWYTLNPHFAAPRGFGVTDFFLPNTSIKGLLLRRCGEPVFTQGLARPVEIVLDIDQPQGVQPGYLVDHMCAVFDDGLGAWSTTGVSSKNAVTNTSTQMICQSSRSYGYFAALYRVVREVPPNTTSPPPPEIEEDTGLGLPAIIALVAGGAIFLGGAIGGIYAWHLARSKKPVEPEEEEEEEVVEESESESEVKELPDPDPALTKLRQAAEAGTLTAREILARHSGPTGIRQELVWALDKGYENKRREAARMKVKSFAQQGAAEGELAKSDSDDDNQQESRTQVKAIKVKTRPR